MAQEKKLSAVIELRDEFSKKMEEVKEKAEEFKEKAEKLKPVIQAKDKVTGKVNKIKKILSDVKKMKNVVKIRAKEKVTDKVNRIKIALSKILTKNVTEIDAKDGVTPKVNKIKKLLLSFKKTKSVAEIDTKDKATPKVNKIHTIIEKLKNSKNVVKIRAKDGVTNKVNKIKNRILNVSKTKSVAEINVKDKVTNKVNKIKKMLSDIPLKNVTEIDAKDKVTGKVENINKKISSVQKNSVVSINAKEKVTDKVKKVKSTLSSLQKMKNTVSIKVKDEVLPKLKRINKDLIKLKVNRMTIKAKDLATRTVKKVGDKLKSIVKKKWEAKVSVKDRATAKLGKIKALMGTLAAGVVIKATLQAGSEFQQQKVAMEHFMGVGNEGKSKQQVHKMTQGYINKLRTNANETPYDTPEVLQAGTRAITMANGNTQQAMRMVKMAEDMAAARPDASLEDAIEAISNARMGEFERMKQFGFKGSKEAFDKAGGDFFKMKNEDGMNVDQVFGGLAEKQKDTPQGMWSTITGNIKTSQQSLGDGFLEGFKPALSKIRDITTSLLGDDKNIDKVKEFGQKMGAVFVKIGSVAKRVFDSIKSALEIMFDNIDFNAIGQAFKPAFDILKEFFDMIINKSPEAGGFFTMLGKVCNIVFTAIGLVVSFLATTIKIQFKAICSAVRFVVTILKGFGDAWKSLKTTVVGVVKKIGGVVDTVFSGINKAVDGVKGALDSFGDAWKSLKTKIENNPITQKIEKITTSRTKSSSSKKSGKRKSAFGFNRIPKNDYPVRLHEGERVLTKNEANLLDNNKYGNGVVINMNGITVREEADIDKVINGVVRRIKLAKAGGV